MKTETVTVTVAVRHSRSYPGTRWVDPVGWTPDLSWADDSLTYDDGSLWGESEEEYGLAIAGYHEAPEGEVIEVPISEVFWSSCGHVRYVRPAEIA